MRTGTEQPGPERGPLGRSAVHYRVHGPTQCGTTVVTTRCTKGGCKPDDKQRMSGADLSVVASGNAPPDKPAFQPYLGKPAVRNDREDRGNVGIIRSPVRASILPDQLRHWLCTAAIVLMPLSLIH